MDKKPLIQRQRIDEMSLYMHNCSVYDGFVVIKKLKSGYCIGQSVSSASHILEMQYFVILGKSVRMGIPHLKHKTQLLFCSGLDKQFIRV